MKGKTARIGLYKCFACEDMAPVLRLARSVAEARLWKPMV